MTDQTHRTERRSITLWLLGTVCLWLGQTSVFSPVPQALSAKAAESGTPGLEKKARWFRGNTHAHTRLCGNSDLDPAAVANLYYKLGYNFLVLSEHNIFIKPETIAMPHARRKNFLLIPGQELTEQGSYGSRVVHVTGLGTRKLVATDDDGTDRTKRLQSYVDRVRAAGGLAILNHPNLSWSLKAHEIRPVRGLHFFELYNGHPHAANFGNRQHPGTEALWDQLLSDGARLYGVAADDGHYYTRPGQPEAGRAWIMVRAAALTEPAIRQAMQAGDFYASTGVFLKSIHANKQQLRIRIDTHRTAEQLSTSHFFGEPITGRTSPGHVPKTAARGQRPHINYDIQFIGPGGTLLGKSSGTHGRFRLANRTGYVRARITATAYLRVGYQDFAWRRFFAWTQPVILKAQGPAGR